MIKTDNVGVCVLFVGSLLVVNFFFFLLLFFLVIHLTVHVVIPCRIMLKKSMKINAMSDRVS